VSRRYDRVSIRMDYSEDFAPVANGTWGGGLNLSWQFLPIDKREDRLAVLLRWWTEDNTPAEANLDIG